ncbi:MAG: hypothetical protein DMG06_09290 [Acidobacteria bacterium]|nr:MAG: hypothetical protein DMG06_09290 [Acidobacteriota bacterium]
MFNGTYARLALPISKDETRGRPQVALGSSWTKRCWSTTQLNFMSLELATEETGSWSLMPLVSEAQRGVVLKQKGRRTGRRPRHGKKINRQLITEV